MIKHMDFRKMKRGIATLVALVVCMSASAQFGQEVRRGSFADNHEIYYGLRLGLGLANVNSDDKRLDGGDTQAGLNIGGVIGFQLSPSAPVYLESGLFYTEKGGKGVLDKKKFTYDLNYLEVPILVKYKYEMDTDLNLVPFAGGYVAMGVGGKIKNFGDRETDSSFSSENFKRFDGGLRFGCGIEYQVLYADMAYEFGLANICHSDWDTSKNGCFYINIGVNF